MAEQTTGVPVEIGHTFTEVFTELETTSSLGDLVDAAAKAAREHNVTVTLMVTPADGG